MEWQRLSTFFFFFRSSKDETSLIHHCLYFPSSISSTKGKKTQPKTTKTCCTLSQPFRPATHLVTHLQEMTPGEGKEKLLFHKYSYFKGQIITSGLKTVTGALNRKIKDFVAFVSCRQDKSFQLHKILAKVITCCSEVLQHFSFFAKFITLNPFPMIKVFWDTEAERYKSALIQGDSDENRLQ